MKFRDLTAADIECRISTVKQNGVSLLLYKDARCDMNILDESVGAECWQRNHEVINGNLFCNVGIKIDGEWIWKQDVGTESYTEKEKGQASDAFKRACFNWGIGRELYTAPFIWISSDNCKIDAKSDQYTCYDHFNVRNIEVVNKRIVYLAIEKKKKLVYEWRDERLTEAQIRTLETCIPAHGQTIEKVCEIYKVGELADLTTTQFMDLMHRMGEDA